MALSSHPLRAGAISVAFAALLSGCGEDGALSFLGDAQGDVAAVGGGTTELVERDVEAPEIFQIAEQGLWDGRPSLGGVWVAHPSVTDPERVIIRNQSNGTFVIGALFRRERENPGPALQVSSDAADALQMLAGAPAPLEVVALRRQEGPSTDATPPATDFEGAATVAPASADAITATPLDGAGSDPVATAPLSGATVPGAAPAPVATPGPAAPVTSALTRPFVQIGIFSVEANANDAAAQMQGADLSARVVAAQVQGRDFWRVIVGPAASEAERDRILQSVAGLGYGDAYAVSN